MEEPSNVFSHFLLSIFDFRRAEGISAEGGKRKSLQMLHHKISPPFHHNGIEVSEVCYTKG